jgi:hypothetical protein
MLRDTDMGVIRQAVSAIAAQLHCDEKQAFEALVDVASATETQLADVAGYVLDGAGPIRRLGATDSSSR